MQTAIFKQHLQIDRSSYAALSWSGSCLGLLCHSMLLSLVHCHEKARHSVLICCEFSERLSPNKFRFLVETLAACLGRGWTMLSLQRTSHQEQICQIRTTESIFRSGTKKLHPTKRFRACKLGS